MTHGEDGGNSTAFYPSIKESLTWNDLDRNSFLINSTLYVLAVDLILYPSDLLTTRLQADKYSTGKVRVSRLLSDIFQREGVRGLFKGFTINTLGHFPGQFLYYSTYEYCNEQLRRLIPSGLSQNSSVFAGFLANATAGVCAELASACSYLPIDIITQRLQVNESPHFATSSVNSSSFKIAKHIMATEGIRGFYRGFWPYMFVYGPGSASWWASYEASKSLIFKIYRSFNLRVSDVGSYSESGGLLKVFCHLFSGAVAGAVGFLTMNPLEVAKTRLQLLEYNNKNDLHVLNRGFLNLLRDVYRSEGIAGLYKGIKPRLLIRTPVSAIAFVGYEYLKETSVQKPSSTA